MNQTRVLTILSLSLSLLILATQGQDPGEYFSQSCWEFSLKEIIQAMITMIMKREIMNMSMMTTALTWTKTATVTKTLTQTQSMRILSLSLVTTRLQ